MGWAKAGRNGEHVPPLAPSVLMFSLPVLSLLLLLVPEELVCWPFALSFLHL